VKKITLQVEQQAPKKQEGKGRKTHPGGVQPWRKKGKKGEQE